MCTKLVFATLGLVGTLALSAAPAQAHNSLAFNFHASPGHHHPHAHVHHHGGRACTVRHGYYYEPYYVPHVRYGPYGPPPRLGHGDDCRWHRGRWHCY